MKLSFIRMRIKNKFCSLMLFTFVVGGYSQNKYHTITDIDGNKYKTSIIGEQEWMVENLRTTRLNDGTSIPNITDNTEWMQASSFAYSWYENENSNKVANGGLYNWHAVNTGKLCPEGWHVPTDTEWTKMIDYMGERDVAFEAITKSEFNVIYGGYRYGYFWGTGFFYEKGVNGYWWTSSENTDTHAWSYSVSKGTSKIYRSYFEKNDGFSIRCVRSK